MNKLKMFPEGTVTEGVDILQKLDDYATAHGFEVFLSGGAVRDQVHGESPRDLDIGVINCPQEHWDGLADIVMAHGWDMTKVYGRDGSSEYCESFEGEEDRYESIMQFESFMGDKPLDLLFYTDSFPTIASVMASHDHTINQYACWFGSLGLNTAYLGDQEMYGQCKQLRRGVTPERVEKVKEMCVRLGWSYEALPPLPPPPAVPPPPEQDWDDDLDELLK